MLLEELHFTDKELHFSFHAVHYLQKGSYCEKRQWERKNAKLKKLKLS